MLGLFRLARDVLPLAPRRFEEAFDWHRKLKARGVVSVARRFS
jgi:hypothetical protein